MGFSNMATQVIMFVSVLVIATALVIFFNNYSNETMDTANIQRQELSDKIKTDVTIDVLNYDNSTNPHTITAYVKNTGIIPINLDVIDVYINKERIPRDINNRTIAIISDTDTINIGQWDSKELILVTVFKNVTQLQTHTFDLILENGKRDSGEFSS